MNGAGAAGKIKFECDKCGECCRHIAGIPPLAAFDRGDGVCVHLRGCECDIYVSRPEVCDVERMYECYFARAYSREEFYAMNARACDALKSRAKGKK